MRTQLVTLKRGIKVGDEYYKDVVLREPIVEDMINAEQAAKSRGEIAFRTALLSVCIERVDGCDVPLTPKMLSQIDLNDYNQLLDVFEELQKQGDEDAKKD